MEYVTPEYEQRLKTLAETLCIRERFEQNAGQLALFETVELPDNVVPIRPEHPEIVA